jgi:hypothetical protein
LLARRERKEGKGRKGKEGRKVDLEERRRVETRAMT